MKTYKVHLIRHGLIQGNDDGVYIGHTDTALSPRGVNDLKDLKKHYVYPEVPVVFSSPLKRCTETAEILFPDNNPVIINDLIEYNFGSFEGHTAKEMQDNDYFKKWLSGDMDAAPPYGESNKEFGDRVAKAFVQMVDGLIKTGVTEAAVITHGGVIMAIMSMFALPEAPMTDWILYNGTGYTLRITPSLWMQTQKCEAIAELPAEPEELSNMQDETPMWADVETTEE